jgi:hypothetical protein
VNKNLAINLKVCYARRHEGPYQDNLPGNKVYGCDDREVVGWREDMTEKQLIALSNKKLKLLIASFPKYADMAARIMDKHFHEAIAVKK